MKNKIISIIGCGNIGKSIVLGLINSKKYEASQFILTRRKIHHLEQFKEKGATITQDNNYAINKSDIIIICVEPQQIEPLLKNTKNSFHSKQIVISVVSGVSINDIAILINNNSIVRAMPNTAIAIADSMTCIASNNSNAIKVSEKIFKCVGKILIIDEEQMISATALGACGIAFFLRAIRSATQGGIEIGFSSEAAFTIAAQTAKGAASLLQSSNNHPEAEIDKVTTPRGCTIAGLNEMEHKGFSSAMIKGITTSAEIASVLYKQKK